MSARPVIGIIGGMGPAAGVDLVRKITLLTRASADQDHLPILLISAPSDIPDRTRFLLSGEGPNPGAPIAEIALRLESAGATVAGMPCNTAHAPPIMERVLHDLRVAGSDLQFVNMIHATVDHVMTEVNPQSRIGILSTTGTRLSRIYAGPLAEAGFEVLELEQDNHDRLMMGALYGPNAGIKVVNPPWTAARKLLAEALDRLADAGADSIILGCTELPLVITETRWRGLPLTDPAEVLARALIHATYPDRLATNPS